MHYEFKTRRYFGNPVRLDNLEAWKNECTIKYGTGVALPVRRLPGTYAFYTYENPETYVRVYSDWADGR